MIPVPMASASCCGWMNPHETKLQQLIRQFGASKAEIIRQLIVQAKPEDFPKSWQMRAHACGARQARQESTHADQEPRS